MVPRSSDLPVYQYRTFCVRDVRYARVLLHTTLPYLIREAELSGDGGEVGRHEALVGEQEHHHRGEQNQREVFRAA